MQNMPQEKEGKLEAVFNKIKVFFGRSRRKREEGEKEEGEKRGLAKALAGKKFAWRRAANLREIMERKLAEKEAPTTKWGRLISKIKRFLRISLHKFGAMRPWKKRALAFAAIVLMLGGAYFWDILNVRSAGYSWVQSNWTGGASTDYANHYDNQTGWTKFWEKDSNVKTNEANKVTLHQATETALQTARGGIPISSISRSGTTVTVTTSQPHNLLVGQAVAIFGVAAEELNGCYSVASVPNTNTATTFTYTHFASGTLSSSGGWVGASSQQATIASSNGVVRNNNIVTVTTTAKHNFLAGMTVVIAIQTGNPNFNGTFIINRAGLESFDYYQAGANDSASGGTARIMGQCASISSASRTSGVTTITTSQPHFFQAGMRVRIVNVVSKPSFNGLFKISATPTATTFTYLQEGQADDSFSGVNASAVMTDLPDVRGFEAGTKTNVQARGTGTHARIALLKPAGASCQDNRECASNSCVSGACAALLWIAGYCGVEVRNADVSGGRSWGSNSSCPSPQCATGMDPGYSGPVLLANNSIDFSSFSARNECKSLGGRLPNMSELNCIYHVWNQSGRGTIFGSTFQSDVYWSATEISTSNAWGVWFANGNAWDSSKAVNRSVRCVK